MYKKLDNIYRNKSFVILYRIFVLLVIIFAVWYLNYLNNKYFFLSNDKISFYIILISIFVVLLFLHLIQYSILIYKKRITKKNWWIVFIPFDCMEEFLDLEYKLDIRLIYNFLIDNGIDNKEKVKVAMDHYNLFISKNNYSLNSSFLSMVALLITIVTYISNDGIHYNIDKLYLIILILGILFIFYLMLWALLKLYYIYFSKDEMYSRIEEGLADIYFHYDEYREKYLKKIIIIKYNEGILEQEMLTSKKYNIDVISYKDIKQYKVKDYYKVYIIRFNKKQKIYNLYNQAVIENDYIVSNIDINIVKDNISSVKIGGCLVGKKANKLFYNILSENGNSSFLDLPNEIDNIKKSFSKLINI